MHFLDQAKIFIRSGAGGPGAVGFRREKFIEYGGPDGGDGGKGGDIVFEAVEGLNTLIDFRYTQHFKAPRGSGGSGQNRTGAGGKDLVIKVPVGTQIISDDKEHVLADIPGLIEGAAEGAGIGDRFLGHIERCRVLLHLVDANAEDVAEAYRIVRDELDAYGAGLEDKAEVVALNKADTLDDELLDALSDELEEECGRRPLRVSGAAGTGIEAVLDTLVGHLTEEAAAEEEVEEGDWSPL